MYGSCGGRIAQTEIFAVFVKFPLFAAALLRLVLELCAFFIYCFLNAFFFSFALIGICNAFHQC